MMYLLKKSISAIGLFALSAGYTVGQDLDLIDPLEDKSTSSEIYDEFKMPESPQEAIAQINDWMRPPAPKTLPPNYTIVAGSNESVEREVLRRIARANSEILFSYHAITSRRFVTQLLDRYHKKKILSCGILDPYPEIKDYRTIEFLLQNNLPILIPESRRAHFENFIIIDRRIVIHGTYYPSNTNSNCHVVIADDPGIANEFYRLWYRRSNQSQNPLKQ